MAREVPAFVMYVTVEPVDYVYGGWCNRCLLPSGVHATVMVTIGPSSTLREFDVCGDCNGVDVNPPVKAP